MKKQINQLGGPVITREKRQGWLNTDVGYLGTMGSMFLSLIISMMFGKDAVLGVCMFWLGFAIALMLVYAIKITIKKKK